MHPDKQQKKIESFWDWFLNMENQFKGYFDDDPLINKEFLIESMNNRVLDFGLFSWQMGQGKERPYYFTISPNGNQQRMELSKSIINTAPRLDDWELYFAKQAKDWDFKLLLYDNFMRECQIDVGLWQFSLMNKPGNKVDIYLKLNGTENIDIDTRLTAIDLAITNIIGEERKIMEVHKIEILEENTGIENNNLTPISQLLDHLVKFSA